MSIIDHTVSHCISPAVALELVNTCVQCSASSQCAPSLAAHSCEWPDLVRG